MAETNLIRRSDEILGGTPVFAGTRAPAQALFDYLEGGDKCQLYVGGELWLRDLSGSVWWRSVA